MADLTQTAANVGLAGSNANAQKRQAGEAFLNFPEMFGRTQPSASMQ